MEYRIYVDLDGVLCDLHHRMTELFGYAPTGQSEKRNAAGEERFWRDVRDLYATGGQFWRPMRPMADVFTLWNYVLAHQPTILTSRGRVPQGEQEKHEWVQEHLSCDRVIVVAGGRKKAQYAAPESILIDDTNHVLDAWREAGGIGIHHVSAQRTIHKLQDYGL